MLRAPLAAAVQWSSPTPSRPCSEGAVGRVYSSAQHNHGGAPAAGYIHMSNAGPQQGHGTLPQQPQPQAQPQAHQPQLGMVPCERMAQPTERERSEEQELERLRRDLRKTEEKANFFRNQVLTLQRQVSSMSSPIMAQQDATALPEELGRLRQDVASLRQELGEERMQRQNLEQQLQGFRNLGFKDPEAVSHALQDLQGARQEQQSQVESLRQQLSTTQQLLETEAMSRMAHPQGHSSMASHVTVPSGSFPTVFESTQMVVSEAFGVETPMDLHCRPNRALIVGCDYPKKPGTIRAGIVDAMQWYRFFQSRCGFDEKDIRLLADDAGNVPVESLSATRDNVILGLKWLVSNCHAGDQLFFIFCGHGAQVPVYESPDRRLCECALVPTDCIEGQEQPRLVRDYEVHQALATLPSGVQVTIIIDGCHAGHPLDRTSDHRFEAIGRGHVDYDKLRHHPVLPRFFELPEWKVQKPSPLALSLLRCQAVLWSACANDQFCVELPIDECRARGVFTYILMSALLKTGVQASCAQIFWEAKELTSQLKGRWRLQQEMQFHHCQATTEMRPFFRR